MLLAPGAARDGRLPAEELRVIPGPAQRPAAAVRSQLPEPDPLPDLVGIHRCPSPCGPIVDTAAKGLGMGLAQIVRTARAASLLTPNGRKIPAMTLGNYEVIAAEGGGARN